MNKNNARVGSTSKVAIGFTIALLAVIAGVVAIIALTAPRPTPSDSALASSTVREDSHVLDDAGEGAVTVVEFLDFECEACGAFYPVVEDLREEFDGQITFVIRYFPLPGHFNSKNAAVAVEAAARQGQLEAMYQRMFATQAEWGEQQVSYAPLFREFAAELGLDLEQYDADVADPATLDRVESDFTDGRALGVQSTPTFFINDQLIELTSFEDLRAAIAAELAR
ncbi:MAG: thioredoxin domain-containing protein [Actinobacteria bacterium]|nr:thioredoxin domain-containing protein [Actinomycetota bacterium]